MFDKHLLIYSNYCNHSQKFAQILSQHPEILSQFEHINIDVDTRTGKRPSIFYDIQHKLDHHITEVPTIIVDNGQYVLSGEEAFKWLDYVTTEQEEDLEPFNPNEMGAFSDMYADFGKNDNARQQSFKFVDKPEMKIHTPQEDNENPHEGFSNIQFKNPSNKIAFTSKNFTSNNNAMSKQKEIDAKLQDLIAERNSMLPKSNKPINVDFSK